MIAKYADRLPLYRQEQVLGRASLATPHSTQASWVDVVACNCSHESMRCAKAYLNATWCTWICTPVQMLANDRNDKPLIRMQAPQDA
ncbi:transposase [Pseudomonas sp. PDM31]|uniref:IS66 family transposase n=1 Tax=Pseudomonas sp. PDM31 TaxID=2854778 RepID=UPI003526CF4F